MRAVHDAVEAHVTAPVDGVLLLQKVTARRTSVRRRRLALVGAVASVAAAAIAASTFRPSVPTRVTHPEPGATTQTVSYRGVQVTVPATWRIGAGRCGSPTEDTVLTPHAGALNELCYSPRSPQVTSVSFEGATYGAGQVKTVVSGTAALMQFTDERSQRFGTFRGSLTIPASNVTVVVAGPDETRVRSILGTVRRISIDENDCPTTFDDQAPSTRAGVDDELLPGEPSSISLCRYDHYRIETSLRLDAAQLLDLQTATNSLPLGVTPPLHQSGCPAQIGGIYVLQAHYASGPDVRVTTKPFSCEGRSPTNGTRTSVLSVTYLNLLNDALVRAPINPPGTVTGFFGIVGGPYPGIRQGLTGTVTFLRGGQRTSTTSDADGQFRVTLPPGTYTAEGMPAGREGTCPGPGRIKVPARGAAGVNVICSIK